MTKEFDLSIEDVSKTYDGQNYVLRGVNFDIPHQQSVALVGHNGSGKSTLLRCCIRLVEPSGGKVTLLGKEIAHARGKELRSVRSQVGFVFQQHNLVPRLSALSNVLHGVQSRKSGIRTWYQSIASTADREEAMYCLERVGLAHLADRRADRLSGGESQRVAIARALMQRPKVMMADEPAAALDPSAGQEVMELFWKLIKDEGITLVFVSHDLEHALSYSDRLIGLKKGQKEIDTTPDRESVETLRQLYQS